MGFLDRHDLLDLNDVLLRLYDVKDSEGSADMEAVDGRGMGILKFFLVSVSRKRVLREFLDLFNDDTPGFWGAPSRTPVPFSRSEWQTRFPASGTSVIL